MSKKIKVFYDGKCNICKREINFYSKIDKDKNFDWVNIHNNTEKIKNTGLSKKELLLFKFFVAHKFTILTLGCLDRI